MNAVERIVEIYFQKIYNCLTCPDTKIKNGNNRQFDLLAYSIKDRKQYHVESSVTHGVDWNPTLAWLIEKIEYKFFGEPSKTDNQSKNTDKAKNKNYLEQIKQQYYEYGFNFEELHRVWVLWCFDKLSRDEYILKGKKYYLKNCIRDKEIEIIPFREIIIPKLIKKIGTSNYEDEIIRTFSLIAQYQKQKTGS